MRNAMRDEGRGDDVEKDKVIDEEREKKLL